MSSLTDKQLKDTYKGILKTTGDNSELDGNYKRITDGNGNDSGVELKGTSNGDARFGGKVQIQGNLEKVDGGGSVTGTYKTETENDSRYLQSVPSEFLTETEGDARYVVQGTPADPTDFVSKANGGTFDEPISIDHQSYFPQGEAKVLHRSQFLQAYHHHIKDSAFGVNNEFAIPWAGDTAQSISAGGYSSSDNPRSKYRFLVPFQAMKLVGVYVKPNNNTFTSYPATVTIHRYFKRTTDDDTANPNITSNGTITMSTTSNPPAGIGQTPYLSYQVDIDDSTAMDSLQTYQRGWEVLLGISFDTTLTNTNLYGVLVTTVWACSY